MTEFEYRGVGGMLCRAGDFKKLFPERDPDCNKYDFGLAVLIGGCREYTGAVLPANMSLSALRCGCGISRLAVEERIADYVAPYLLESTLMPLSSFCEAELSRAFSGAASVGIGMGFGRSSDRIAAVGYALSTLECPLLIDADGLWALSRTGYVSRGNVVITPHLGEFRRLYGDVDADDSVKAAVEYAGKNNVVVLLKGRITTVTDGERVLFIDRGCPGMATAGSGDVLSGVITGINAQNGSDLCLNAACGAYICGAAGELAEREKNAVSMTASDTVSKLHEAVGLIIGK